ncbi:MAG TPA: AgmX/PglI C-terminal domain-containing protein [Bdellovibrionales bacterium]|nr:AgmX/PglI C-terminal domain-containing protein [Bdellovibrionales bacterium]
MKKPVVLRIFKGEQLLGVKQFTDPQVVFGRPGDVQVPLDGDKVSVIHAAIEERDSGYYVCDLGSETGTFKNGEQVLDAPIESGDIVQVGEFRIEFFIGVPKPKGPPGETAVAAAPIAAEPPPVQKKEPAPAPTPKKPEVSTPEPMAKSAPTTSMFERVAAASTVAAASSITDVPTTNALEGGMPLAGPSFAVGGPARRNPSAGKHSKNSRRKKTFAPPSKHASVRDYVKPTKGTVVEVLIAWRERVIATHHFSKKQLVTVGSQPDCDIILPLLSGKVRKLPLLKLDAQVIVLVSGDMKGELVRGQTASSFAEVGRQNRMVKVDNSFGINLEQGEMVRLDLSDDLSIFIRYVSDSPKPLVAPLLDLTTSEFAGVIFSFVLVAVLWLYMILYTPPKPLPDELGEEPLRTAVIIAPPTPKPAPVAEAEAPTPAPTPQRVVVKSTPAPTKMQEAKAPAKPATATNLTTKNDPGKSANAAPNKNKTGPRTVTSPKQGGSIKTTDKPASQMKSPQRDVSKSGVFSVFGGGGANDQLAQSTSGSGELAGLADAATGKSGYAENRAVQGLGSAVKDTGRGGTGNALTGIDGGVGTQGRGSGNSGYGTGGLGNRAGIRIVPGGDEAAISGSYDREAIRRVIMANLRVIRTCYERQLNRNPDLMGKLVLSWVIGEQGRVTATRVKSNELGNAEVANCIMDRLRTWRFPDPPASNEVEVEAYPFFFSN